MENAQRRGIHYKDKGFFKKKTPTSFIKELWSCFLLCLACKQCHVGHFPFLWQSEMLKCYFPFLSVLRCLLLLKRLRDGLCCSCCLALVARETWRQGPDLRSKSLGCMQPPSFQGGSHLELRRYELSLLFSVHISVCLFANILPTNHYSEGNPYPFTEFLSYSSLTQNCLHTVIARMNVNCWRLSSSAGEVATVIYFPSQNGAVECIPCLMKAIYFGLEYSLSYSLGFQAHHKCFCCYLTQRLFPQHWLTHAGQQSAATVLPRSITLGTHFSTSILTRLILKSMSSRLQIK